MRAALTKGIRAFGELVGQKKAKDITADDIVTGSELMLSVFIREPQFQSQTKDRLTSPEAARLVENAVRDHFDHFLSDNMERGRALLGYRDRADGRAPAAQGRARGQAQDRDQRARKLRLPGKLTDCSAKAIRRDRAVHRRGRQRRRHRQAGARPQDPGDPADPRQDPQRRQRHRRQDPRQQEIADLTLALGCGTRKDCDPDNLRYDRVVIMTDADVDGAHIATLLMTFFFQEMPEIVRRGHLYLAQPPLYRLTAGKKSRYARDDAAPRRARGDRVQGQEGRGQPLQGPRRDEPGQLRETTMDPKTPQPDPHHPAAGI